MSASLYSDNNDVIFFDNLIAGSKALRSLPTRSTPWAATMRSGIVALALMCVARGTLAFCVEPATPSSPWGGPPNAPHRSVNSIGHDRCSDWDIDRYRREVEAYFDVLQRYVNAANRYASEAYAYADCQSREAVSDWNRFVA